jgi:hypothetical protein
MTTEGTPSAPTGEVNLLKDPVTGEMISKRHGDLFIYMFIYVSHLSND